jgi:DNA repair exonuclease SbcCD nuclease subunit
MDISFIHTADVHIGKKFSVAFNINESKKRRRELWETFDKIIEICIRNNVDFLFIAGDLTDGKYSTMEDVKRLVQKFGEAKNTNIIFTTGNRDPYAKYSLYKYVDWSENVYLIEETKNIQKIFFEDKNLCVYSIGFNNEDEMKERTSLYEVETNNDNINVLIIHGDIHGNDTVDLKIDVDRLNGKFDYIALGHVHQYMEYSERVIYAGTPEPLDFSEKGQHGVVYGKISKNNFEKVFVPVAKSRFITKEIFIQPEFGYEKILDIIKFSGDYISVSKDYFRIVLSGQVNMDIDIEGLKREASNYFQFIEFSDNYLYYIDYESLLNENNDNIIGDFIKYYQSKNEQNLKSQKSFLLGLDALMKEKVN